MLVQGASTQVPRLMSEPQHNLLFLSSVASQVVGKMQKFSKFNGDPTHKGEVLFKQWSFEVSSVLQSHTEATLWEATVRSLCRAKADLN